MRPDTQVASLDRFAEGHTSEAIIGGVAPSLSSPETLLLGRLDEQGRLRYSGRTHSLRPAQGRS
ncbi:MULTISPECIES: hypothetical protein [unclassified Micromonospora]|uniref:hypothetical protein n=1 Tax=unclassified Micromonospora TaxID=2617518 RepID=UPI002FEE9E1F